MNFTFFLVFFIINENKLKILARNSLYQHLKSTKKKKKPKKEGIALFQCSKTLLGWMSQLICHQDDACELYIFLNTFKIEKF